MNLNTPPGVNPPTLQERMPVFQAVCGDDWILDFSLFNPVTKQPATMSNTLVTIRLTDNRFSDNSYWQGAWGEGILPDSRLPGLVHVVIPKIVTSSLRRGVYTYSILVTDTESEMSSTQQVGYIQVEYESTSPQHNIPYRQPIRSDKTQYVTQGDLDIAVLNAVKSSVVYSNSVVKQLAEVLSKGVTAPEDPSFDDIIGLLRTIANNLEAAKNNENNN